MVSSFNLFVLLCSMLTLLLKGWTRRVVYDIDCREQQPDILKESTIGYAFTSLFYFLTKHRIE